MGLSARSREAVEMLRRCADHDDGWGVITSGASARFDGQAWINWRTVEALEDRGLVEVARLDNAVRLRGRS